MLKKIVFGKPFITNSVVKEISESDVICDSSKIMKEFSKGGFIYSSFPDIKIENKNIAEVDENIPAIEFTIPLSREDMIFGLGESMGGINKRGRIYKMWCTDDPNHTEDKEALYGAHPFFIIYSPERKVQAGFFIDFPGKIILDAGFTCRDYLKITVYNENFNLFYINPENLNLNETVELFRNIIGQSYQPPFWAFGYMQSRWGYGSQKDLETVYQEHKKRSIPLDAIFLDIDYMKHFRDFTVDEEKFSDFKGCVDQLKKNNVHVVPIIDAGIKADEVRDDVCKEGIEKDMFCKKADGSLFKAGVWPGLSVFTDFMKPEARKWFGSYYKRFTDAGIDGFWNDMNEPAMFFTPEGFGRVKDEIKKTFPDDLKDFTSMWGLKEAVLSTQNNDKDYKNFYHRVPKNEAGALGEKEAVEKAGVFALVRHDKIHNLYGASMTRAASEFFTENIKDRKILLFSRASFIGSHRYGGIWTGDNTSWWSHILLCLKQLPGLNMCGYLYSGCDTGGFGGNTNRELLMRFIALSVFTPLFRNHSAAGTREQEVYRFEDVDDFKALISFRYRIIPYLSSEYKRCAEEGSMLFKPLAFEYQNDEVALHVEDQLMFGSSLMIAPVYTENAKGRAVYIPEEMEEIRCTKEKGLISGMPEKRILEKGMHYIPCKPEEIVFFKKKNHSIAVSNSAMNTANLDMKNLEKW